MSVFQIDAKEIDGLTDALDQFSKNSGPIIDEVFHGEGAEEIKKSIAPLIPRSGRRWKKKGRAAADAMPASFKQDNGTLAVTIAARGKYHYLYFPDDGSNTIRHAGNQQFMARGGEKAAPKVVDRCIQKLIENFGG